MPRLASGQKIAVVGSGISGLSAAWALSRKHDVTLIEAADRIGGHSRTVDVPVAAGRTIAVDTGFIVYNDSTYRNLSRLFDHLGVGTRGTDMSFAVSLDDGRLEYAAREGLRGLFAQRSNLVSPRFWRMLRDLIRFYREAPAHAGKLGLATLGDFLAEGKYSQAFRDDHLLPMAAAIWSAPAPAILDYPAEAFIRFCDNHGLLKLSNRPKWRTVIGGSRAYVQAMRDDFGGRVCTARAVTRIDRDAAGVTLVDLPGHAERFDQVVIAAHAPQALAMLGQPSALERALLAPFRYSRNAAVLHSDTDLMPRRRSAWASWNYLGRRAAGGHQLSVSYWMNALQGLESPAPLIVTLNPARSPRPGTVHDSVMFEHPLFDNAALAAQRDLWRIQGADRIWYAGAWFGAGFHEDGLQSGLAVAEALGCDRPWTIDDPSDRIVTGPALPDALAA